MIVLLEARGDDECSGDSQHCGREWESGHPEKLALPPVTQVSFGATGVVGDDFPRALGTSMGVVTGHGTQMALIDGADRSRGRL